MYDPDLACLLGPCLGRLLSGDKYALLAATVRNEETFATFSKHFGEDASYNMLNQLNDVPFRPEQSDP